MAIELSTEQKQAIFDWLRLLNLESLSDKVCRLLINDMTGEEKLDLLHEIYVASVKATAEKIKEHYETKAIKL